MMKKLAVTVFALSLAAIGCGSDSGTPAKKDATVDTKTIDSQSIDTVKTDTAIGPEAGAETQADKPIGPDSPVDGVVTPVDTQPTVEVQPIDVQPTVDGPKRDTTPPIDAIQPPVDGGPKLDVQPAVDGGADDVASVG